MIYALDNLDMTITYVFTMPGFSQNLLEAITMLDLFPRPAAVRIKFITEPITVWGFGRYNQNFTNGNFIFGDF